MSFEASAPLPASFVALYTPQGRQRPTVSTTWLAERHEFCEDLAQLLSETARQKQWELGLDEATVLKRLHAGLLQGEPALPPDEAWWVMRRLVEVLDWPLPRWLTRPAAAAVADAAEPAEALRAAPPSPA